MNEESKEIPPKTPAAEPVPAPAAPLKCTNCGKIKGTCDCGRDTVMTPEVIGKLEYAFSIGCTDLEACLHADIGKTALYSYQKKNPAFAERKELLKETLVLKSRMVISVAIDKGSAGHAAWYLERKRKDEFSTRQENLNETHNSEMVLIELPKNGREENTLDAKDKPADRISN